MPKLSCFFPVTLVSSTIPDFIIIQVKRISTTYHYLSLMSQYFWAFFIWWTCCNITISTRSLNLFKKMFKIHIMIAYANMLETRIYWLFPWHKILTLFISICFLIIDCTACNDKKLCLSRLKSLYQLLVKCQNIVFDISTKIIEISAIYLFIIISFTIRSELCFM